MTVDRAWIEARLAEAPPLTDAQLAAIRTVFRPVIPRTPAAAARSQAAAAITAHEIPGKEITDARL